MTNKKNVRLVFGIKFHQRYLLFTLNQTKQTIDSEEGVTGSFQTKSHLEWIRYLQGNYTILIDGNNVKCNLFAKKNHQRVNMTFYGIFSFKRIDLDYIIEQNIFKENHITGKILYKTKYLAKLLKLNLEMGARNFLLTVKTKWNEKELFDFSIESKKLDPGRIRIKYESKNNKKLLKSEIKYQNNQLAGCNFQLNFDSPKKFLMIAKVKFQDNAFELDIINNEEQRLFINIFLENKSILVVSLHKMKKTTDVLKFKMTSIYESLHDIDLFLEKDTGIQQILLKLNDFDGNMTLRDNMMLEQGESLLIHSNLDFMRNLQIDVNLNTTKGHAKVIYVKLNQKFFRIVWNSKDPERSGNIDFEVEGPWGNVTGGFQFQNLEESIQINLIFNDTHRRVTALKAKFLDAPHNLKLQIEIVTPVTEDYELLMEMDKQLKFMEFKMSGLKSQNVYIDLRVQVHQADDSRGLKATIKSFWIPAINCKISATGNFNEIKNNSLILEAKYGDNFYFRSDLSLKRTKEKTILQVDAHISKNHVVFKMRMDQRLKNFQYFLRVGEQLYSELKLTISDEAGFEATMDFLPFLNQFDSYNLKLSISSSFQSIKIELKSSSSFKKIFTFNLELEKTIMNLNIDLSITTTVLPSLNMLEATLYVDFVSMEVKLEIKTNNQEHNLLIYGKMVEGKCFLEIKANLPFFSLFNKNIKISVEWGHRSYKLVAQFNKSSLNCSIVIEDSIIYATLSSPISGLNEVKANLSYINATKFKSCNFKIQIDYHEINGFIKNEGDNIEVSLVTTIEKLRRLYFKAASSPFTLQLTLNDLELKIISKNSGNNEVDFKVSVQTTYGTLKLDLKYVMQPGIVVNCTLFIKYEERFGSIIFYHETNKLEVEILSSFYDSKRFEIHWAFDDLKVKVSSKSLTWFESSLKYSYPHSWTGRVDFSLFINYFGFKKIKIYSDFSLPDKQKELALNLTYGSKVYNFLYIHNI